MWTRIVVDWQAVKDRHIQEIAPILSDPGRDATSPPQCVYAFHLWPDFGDDVWEECRTNRDEIFKTGTINLEISYYTTTAPSSISQHTPVGYLPREKQNKMVTLNIKDGLPPEVMDEIVDKAFERASDSFEKSVVEACRLLETQDVSGDVAEALFLLQKAISDKISQARGVSLPTTNAMQE